MYVQMDKFPVFPKKEKQITSKTDVDKYKPSSE